MTSKRRLFIVCGQPASGKSTFARDLAARVGGCLVDIDTATEPIVRAAMSALTGNPDDRDSPDFKTRFREPIHDCLFSIALENLKWTHVVVAAPFTKEQRDPQWLRNLGREAKGAKVMAAYLTCEADTLRLRLQRRGNPRDRAKLDNWHTYQRYHAQGEAPAFPHLAVDSADPESSKNALNRLSEGL